MYKNFDEVVAAVKQREIERTVAIAGAHDAPVVEAALRAEQQDIAIPIFVGHGEKIKDILRSFDRNPSDSNVINSPENTEAQTAVDLVKDGSANVLMKGLIETRDMLHPVGAKANDLRTGKLMSHVVFFSNVPNYHKLLVATDGGMVMYPTLEEKVGIVENAVEAMRKMGYKMPRVAVLAAIEKVNPKMRATVEAAELKRMNREGLIQHCIVEGPLSYDVAMDKAIAHHKGVDCEYCGDFDALILPDIDAGNILGKCLIVTAKAEMGGVIMGAKVPIVLTSRGSSAEEKFFSIAVASLMAGQTL